MTILIALIMFLLGAFVCYLVIINYIGRKAPNSVKGKAYLKHQLIKSGYDIAGIPDVCFDEFVLGAEKAAKMLSYVSKEPFLINFTKFLDADVAIFWQWRNNPDDSFFRHTDGYEHSYRAIFERYNIK